MSKSKSSVRVISMVPSWTEMLTSLNIKPVGRTRFCIEPIPDVLNIPIVGGTKDWNLNLVQSLTPDLIILDKDENPKSMTEGHTIPMVITHVRDIESCIEGIEQIAHVISQSRPDLGGIIDSVLARWQHVENTPLKTNSIANPDQLPGLIQWIKKPENPVQSIHYLIWKNPWMQATRETFIGAIAAKAGLPLSTISTGNPYPEIDLHSLNSDHSLLLFSSEPYPFHKKTNELKSLPFASAIVDGQSFSWFGVRSLKFLESLL